MWFLIFKLIGQILCIWASPCVHDAMLMLKFMELIKNRYCCF
uniref:Uncharacterized protein n=1 Tax=Arundo donax TaxID=35708 RepID=A0A0A9E4E3_ARUDO